MMNSVELSNETIPSQDHSECVKCGVLKPRDAFAPSEWKYRRKRCRSCNAQYQRELRASGYKPTGRNKALADLSPEMRARHDCVSRLLNSAQGNARKRTRECTLTHDQIMQLWAKQEGKCALSGLTLDTQQHSQLIASLDRIAPELPYTADNVRLLCWAVNRARGTMTDAEYIEVCLAVVRCNDYPARE